MLFAAGALVPRASRPEAQLELAQARLRSRSLGRRYSACTHGGAHPPVETLASITGAGEAPGSSRSAAKKGNSRSTSPTGSAGRTWRRPWQGFTTRYRRKTAPGRASSPPTMVKRGHRLLRPGLRAPEAISGHNSYYIWGPGDCAGEVVISVGVPRGDLEAVFGESRRRP